MKNVSIIISIIAFFLLSSCRDDDEKNGKEKLIGKWNWVNSIGGHTGNTEHSPQIDGYTMQYFFKENDSVIITINENTIYHKAKYHLTKENSILFQDEYDFLTIDYIYYDEDNNPIKLPMRYIIYNISNNNLKLVEDVYDGYALTLNK